MTKEKIIKLWKENDIDYVNFIFSCGGDSMNETDFEIKTKSGDVIQNSDIEDYFDNEVYNEVNFYVNSDGVYMGESGNVYIRLEENDEEEYFTYDKESEEEWCEQVSFEEYIDLTDEEVEFIENYVTDINGSSEMWEYNINYKEDFLKTDELVVLEENLIKKIGDYFKDYEPNLDNPNDWSRFEILGDDVDKENKRILITMHFEEYVYKISEG